MTSRRIRLCDCPELAWKNGGGLTRELFAWPAGDHWQIRISIAEVTRSGPFSVFPTARRWFAVLEGQGVILNIKGQPVRLDRTSDPFEFDGAAQTHCEVIDGTTRDFNLMLRGPIGRLRRLQSATAVEWVESESTDLGKLKAVIEPGALAAVGVYPANRSLLIRHASNEFTLEPQTLFWFPFSTGAPAIELEGTAGGDYLIVEIER